LDFGKKRRLWKKIIEIVILTRRTTITAMNGRQLSAW
jgi:hypothetical protein